MYYYSQYIISWFKDSKPTMTSPFQQNWHNKLQQPVALWLTWYAQQCILQRICVFCCGANVPLLEHCVFFSGPVPRKNTINWKCFVSWIFTTSSFHICVFSWNETVKLTFHSPWQLLWALGPQKRQGHQHPIAWIRLTYDLYKGVILDLTSLSL